MLEVGRQKAEAKKTEIRRQKEEDACLTASAGRGDG